MSRQEVLERRSQMMATSSAEEHRKLIEQDIARYEEADAQAPNIILRPDGTYLSEFWCSRFLGVPVQKIRDGFRRPFVNMELPGSLSGQTCSCLLAQHFEGEVDWGRFRESQIGRLEVMELSSLDDLGHFERETIEPQLNERFQVARQDAANPTQVWAWPGQRDVGEFRSVHELLQDHAVELGYDHYSAVVKWVRALAPSGGD